MRKRLETRHRRELRRARFDAIRDSLADLLGAYRDLALLSTGAGAEAGGGSGLAGVVRRTEGGSDAAEPGAAGGGSGFPGAVREAGAGREAGAAPLVHPDKAGTHGRLAAGLDPAAALRAAGALEEADRRLAIGAAPLLTLEAAFLSAQAALRGPAVPINRLAIRR
jgi:hypothetical protein